MSVRIIADSGSTKCEWCIINGNKKKVILTKGINPYFMTIEETVQVLSEELVPALKKNTVDAIHFYGTGLGNINNVLKIKTALKQIFGKAKIEIQTDLVGAARAMCNKEKGVVCILGTGSNSCYYNGKTIVKNHASLGYILGDEGSGAYLGKQVIRYYLYNTFDDDLRSRFDAKYVTTTHDIIENTYTQPFANRYLASFTTFLAENRGHYMIENILEDGFSEFFYHHIYKYRESWTHPIHFVGGVAFAFKDILKEMCGSFELEFGKVSASPMKGLIEYHKEKVKSGK